MTRAYRRDKDTKSGSVLVGLRMEPALAQAVTAEAHALAARLGAQDERGDVAVTVRHLLRQTLGWTEGTSLTSERAGGWTEAPIAGLRCESTLAGALRKAAQQHGLGVAGCARHLLRGALGWSVGDSMKIESGFAQIAQARKSMAVAASRVTAKLTP